MAKLSHYLRRSWDNNEQRQLDQLQQRIEARYSRQSRVVAINQLSEEVNRQVMAHHFLRNRIIVMKGLDSLPTWKQSKLDLASSLKSRFYLIVMGPCAASLWWRSHCCTLTRN